MIHHVRQLPGIYLDNLHFAYDEDFVLEGVSGFFPKGGMTALIGPNGAGKTTLLKMICGLLKPHHGKIAFEGFSESLTPAQRPPRITYFRQFHSLERHFPVTVADTVFLSQIHQLGWHQQTSLAHNEKCDRALRRLGLWDLRHKNLAALSQGQLQRVYLARFLAEDGDILLLDEPLNFVDESSFFEIMQLLQELVIQGKTIITILHDLEVVKHHFDHVFMLSKKTIGWGRTKEVLTKERWLEAVEFVRT